MPKLVNFIDPFCPEYKWGLLCVILAGAILGGCIGCNNPTPPGPIEVTIHAPPINDDETILAAELAEQLTGNGPNPNPDITPTPNVKPGDRCPQCEGTGKFDGDRDGTPDGPCHHCNADGKVDEGDPILVGEVQVERSIVVEPITRSEFDNLEETLKNFVKSWTESAPNIAQKIAESASTLEQIQARINEESAKTSALVDGLSKATDEIGKLKTKVESSSLQEKAKPQVQPKTPVQQGEWRQIKVRICTPGVGCQDVIQWRFYPAKNPQSNAWPSYPTQSVSGKRYYVTINGMRQYNIPASHLSQEHGFNHQWVSSLSYASRLALHSDAHTNQVREEFVVRD
jgi:hypothetical protein